MSTVGRFLQFAALVILPLAMVAQLGNQITASKMLQFMLMGVGLFLLGYLMQRYSGTSE